MKIKPCPCGELNPQLDIQSFGESKEWALVSTSCCGCWLVEFNTKGNFISSAKCMELAILEWNLMPRKDDEY